VTGAEVAEAGAEMAVKCNGATKEPLHQ